MAQIIFLDTHPLSNAVVSPAKAGQALTYSQQCRQWIADCEVAGRRIYVPAIAYYEQLRELERRDATAQIRRLKAFCFQPGRFIPVTTAHLEDAARLWGTVRKAGESTASPSSLDADVLIAAQILSFGLSPSEYVVATSNVKHLSRYVRAEEWGDIRPGGG